MARYKKFTNKEMQFVPINFQEQIVPGTFEYALDKIIDEKIDMNIFEKKYKNDDTGAPAFSPSVLLKIVLFGYSKGFYSSRKLEEACRNNILFKALTGNAQPHFTTISSFISSMKDEIKSIFQNVLLICFELELIDGNMFAVDGCKITSNASKEWSGTFKDLEKKKKKLEKIAEKIVQKHLHEDHKNEKQFQKSEANKKKNQLNRILKKAEKIEKFLAENEKRMGKRSREIKSNITDNDSTKMKTSHGVIQGYNGIAVADSKNQVIVGAEVFGSGPEVDLLEPMIENVNENMAEALKEENFLEEKTLLADTGYFSEDNLKSLADKNINGIIPDQQFRKRNPLFKDRERFKACSEEKHFTKEFFEYDKKKNEYICRNGKRLKYMGHYRLNSNNGDKYQAKQSDCQKCKLKDRCLKRTNSQKRTLYLMEEKYDKNYSKEMIKKIDTPEIRELYGQRMGIIEPVFSNITYCKGLNRFTLRSKSKVNIQWLLYCLVHNIEKISKTGVSFWSKN